MARYHLSPKDGLPRKCSARIKCEYASENDGAGVEHYDNKADAMKAYENNMSAENDTFKKVSKNTGDKVSGSGGSESRKVLDTISGKMMNKRHVESFHSLQHSRDDLLNAYNSVGKNDSQRAKKVALLASAPNFPIEVLSKREMVDAVRNAGVDHSILGNDGFTPDYVESKFENESFYERNTTRSSVYKAARDRVLSGGKVSPEMSSFLARRTPEVLKHTVLSGNVGVIKDADLNVVHNSGVAMIEDHEVLGAVTDRLVKEKFSDGKVYDKNAIIDSIGSSLMRNEAARSSDVESLASSGIAVESAYLSDKVDDDFREELAGNHGTVERMYRIDRLNSRLGGGFRGVDKIVERLGSDEVVLEKNSRGTYKRVQVSVDTEAVRKYGLSREDVRQVYADHFKSNVVHYNEDRGTIIFSYDTTD